MLDDFQTVLNGFEALATAFETYLLTHSADAEAPWVIDQAAKAARNAIELAQAALRHGFRW